MFFQAIHTVADLSDSCFWMTALAAEWKHLFAYWLEQVCSHNNKDEKELPIHSYLTYHWSSKTKLVLKSGTIHFYWPAISAFVRQGYKNGCSFDWYPWEYRDFYTQPRVLRRTEHPQWDGTAFIQGRLVWAMCLRGRRWGCTAGVGRGCWPSLRPHFCLSLPLTNIWSH